jgi:hypothetical protein
MWDEKKIEKGKDKSLVKNIKGIKRKKEIV